MEKGGFIQQYIPYGSAKNERMYRLVDPLCLFYLKNVKENLGKDRFWESNIDSQSIVVWKGLAFENLCFNHINKIKEKLGIKWMSTNECMWFQKGEENKKGTQIDLLIERKDNIINLCEAKFYSAEVLISKEAHLNLINKTNVLKEHTNKKTSLMNVLITTYGLKSNEYSFDYL